MYRWASSIFCFLHANEYLILHLQFNKTRKMSQTKLALKKREKFKSIMFYSVERLQRGTWCMLFIMFVVFIFILNSCNKLNNT